MAGSSLFALLDDIATLLDDISLMSKVAAKKSASVLSDDLAVNAEQVTGMKADRELPVVWAVFKGSLRKSNPGALCVGVERTAACCGSLAAHDRGSISLL
jgi:predicted DNA repair protein MutK